MKRSNREFDEIRIRNVPADKKVRLKQRAAAEGKTLQAFMYENALRLADGEEINDVQVKMTEQQTKLLEIIESNTLALQENNRRWEIVFGDGENELKEAGKGE